jgi:hypothetical protein
MKLGDLICFNGLAAMVSCFAREACGEEDSGSALRSGTKPASMKQEENSGFGQI